MYTCTCLLFTCIIMVHLFKFSVWRDITSSAYYNVWYIRNSALFLLNFSGRCCPCKIWFNNMVAGLRQKANRKAGEVFSNSLWILERDGISICLVVEFMKVHVFTCDLQIAHVYQILCSKKFKEVKENYLWWLWS